jgi:large subunit ribosomal protein L6
MTNDQLTVNITLPEETTFETDGETVTVKGPNGETTKTVTDKRITVSGDDETLTLTYPRSTKRAKRLLYSNASRVKNMVTGVTDGFEYKLKICSGHFPMQVKAQGNELIVENFLGETVPRRVTVHSDVDIDVDGDIVTLTSNDKELAGQAAGRIENLCKRSGFDERIFQDGIYITQKPEKATQKR